MTSQEDRIAQAVAQRLKSLLPTEPSGKDGDMGVSVSMALDEYMEGRGGSCRTHDKNRTMIDHLLRHISATKPAARVRQIDVDRYERARTEEGASGKTTWNELALLRTALRYAWKNDRIPAPPKFSLRRPRSERRRVCWPDEMGLLFRAANFPLRRILSACYAHGFRRGEVISMRWDWVQRGAVEIPAGHTKTGAARTCTFDPMVWAMLQLPPRHPDWVFARWSKGKTGNQPIHAARYWPTTLQREWRALLRKCGVRNLTLHDLRRSMASVGAARGHSPATIQQAGAWADPTTVARHYSWSTAGAVAGLARDLLGAVVSAENPDGALNLAVKLTG